MSEPHEAKSTAGGPGRALVAVYAVFAIAATARSTYQLLTKAGDAPLAYSLSAVAGIVYIGATFALATDRRLLAGLTIAFELIGVLVVGLLTVLDTADFPEATVWSQFGAGYGYVPLILPLLGLWWLRHTSPTPKR